MQDISEQIRGCGLRATKQRVRLLSFLHKTKRPMSIRDIAESLTKTVDAVTVYRMTESFIEKGLVRQIDLRRGHPLYEISDPHDHHHVVCTKCERVEDFDICNYETMSKKALKQVPSFAAINSHSFELFGLCKKCAI